jgi:hypothetical protein
MPQGYSNEAECAVGRFEKNAFVGAMCVFGDSGWACTVLNCKLKLPCQLVIVQASQGRWSLEGFIQPRL